MNQNEPKKELSKLKKKARRRKVIQYRAEGKTIDEITKLLNVSDSTIDRDLKSQDAKEFIEELIRHQILDIQKAKLTTRLHFRSDLLDKLLPKKMEQKIEGGESAFRVEIIDNTKPKPEPNPIPSAS